jgi:hypothetical protein
MADAVKTVTPASGTWGCHDTDHAKGSTRCTASRWPRSTGRPRCRLRAAMGIGPNIRTRDALPIFCELPADQSEWTPDDQA